MGRHLPTQLAGKLQLENTATEKWFDIAGKVAAGRLGDKLPRSNPHERSVYKTNVKLTPANNCSFQGNPQVRTKRTEPG